MLVIHPFDITIILPMYNAADYVSYAVNSVLEQDFDGNIELIAIDDGSTDETFEIVQELSCTDPRTFVRLIQQKENLGVSAARNKGLAYATGEFVAFLDADDQLLPTFCSDMVSAARTDLSDLVIGAHRSVACEGDMRDASAIDTAVFDFTRCYRPFDQTFLADLFWEREMGHSIWSKLYKRELLGDFSYTHYFEDYPYNLGFISRCSRISSIASEVYCFRVGTGRSLTDDKYENCGWEAQVVEDYIVRRFVEQESGRALSPENLAKADQKILRDAASAIAGGAHPDAVRKSSRYIEAVSRLG